MAMRHSLVSGRAVAAIGLVAMAVAAGCGENFPETVVTGGVVTHRGKPVSLGTISFQPAARAGAAAARPATGVLAPDGSYQLHSFRHGDGVMPGQYHVTIESYEEGGPTAEDTDRPLRWRIPEKYGHPTTSGLIATIPADASGALTINFDLP
jgi:hypothetical protein